jgi:hypothetical protein
MEDALKLIIAKSPAAMSEAIKTIRAIHAHSPILQQRYIHTVETALNDQEAEFTSQERAQLSQYLEISDISEVSSRDFTLRVRLTESEKARLLEDADNSGLTMSELVRRKLFE